MPFLSGEQNTRVLNTRQWQLIHEWGGLAPSIQQSIFLFSPITEHLLMHSLRQCAWYSSRGEPIIYRVRTAFRHGLRLVRHLWRELVCYQSLPARQAQQALLGGSYNKYP